MIGTAISAFFVGLVIGGFVICLAGAWLNTEMADYRADLSGAPEGDQTSFGQRLSSSKAAD